MWFSVGSLPSCRPCAFHLTIRGSPSYFRPHSSLFTSSAAAFHFLAALFWGICPEAADGSLQVSKIPTPSTPDSEHPTAEATSLWRWRPSPPWTPPFLHHRLGPSPVAEKCLRRKTAEFEVLMLGMSSSEPDSGARPLRGVWERSAGLFVVVGTQISGLRIGSDHLRLCWESM